MGCEIVSLMLGLAAGIWASLRWARELLRPPDRHKGQFVDAEDVAMVTYPISENILISLPLEVAIPNRNNGRLRGPQEQEKGSK